MKATTLAGGSAPVEELIIFKLPSLFVRFLSFPRLRIFGVLCGAEELPVMVTLLVNLKINKLYYTAHI